MQSYWEPFQLTPVALEREKNTKLTVHKIFLENEVFFKDSNEEFRCTRQGAGICVYSMK